MALRPFYTMPDLKDEVGTHERLVDLTDPDG